MIGVTWLCGSDCVAQQRNNKQRKSNLYSRCANAWLTQTQPQRGRAKGGVRGGGVGTVRDEGLMHAVETHKASVRTWIHCDDTQSKTESVSRTARNSLLPFPLSPHSRGAWL